MEKQWILTVNDEQHTVTGEADTPVIWPLRNQLGLLSPRFGCGDEDCGACRILLDGKPAFACTLKLEEIRGKSLETLEGLQQKKVMKCLQSCFLEHNAGQCGYCLSGILVTATAFLTENCLPDKPLLDRRTVQQALDDHLCRCGAH
ncbi:MAG: 2Fe-2S iron-sulfur cluster-binding protein, partial [Gammaproteobacteria bacterium]|nr:2Fe-2S iron-sulfur cluster-binding protein [Gammaproteobacteria bacterium]